VIKVALQSEDGSFPFPLPFLDEKPRRSRFFFLPLSLPKVRMRALSWSAPGIFYLLFVFPSIAEARTGLPCPFLFLPFFIPHVDCNAEGSGERCATLYFFPFSPWLRSLFETLFLFCSCGWFRLPLCEGLKLVFSFFSFFFSGLDNVSVLPKGRHHQG